MLTEFDRKSWIRLIIYGVIFLGLGLFTFLVFKNNISEASFEGGLPKLYSEIMIYGTLIQYICLFFLFFSMDFLSPYDGILKAIKYILFFAALSGILFCAIGSAVVLFGPVLARQELKTAVSPWILSLTFLPVVEYCFFFGITTVENNNDGRGRLKGMIWKLSYMVVTYVVMSVLLHLHFFSGNVIFRIVCYIVFPIFYLFSIGFPVYQIKQDGLELSSAEHTASEGYAYGKKSPMEVAVMKAVRGNYTESKNGTTLSVYVARVSLDTSTDEITFYLDASAKGRQNMDDINSCLGGIELDIMRRARPAVAKMKQKYPKTFNGEYHYDFRPN